MCIACPEHFIQLEFIPPNTIWWKVEITKLLIMPFSSSSCFLLGCFQMWSVCVFIPYTGSASGFRSHKFPDPLHSQSFSSLLMLWCSDLIKVNISVFFCSVMFSWQWLWRMPSFGLWCHMGSCQNRCCRGTYHLQLQGGKNVQTRNLSSYWQMTHSSETSVLTRSMQCHIPENNNSWYFLFEIHEIRGRWKSFSYFPYIFYPFSY